MYLTVQALVLRVTNYNDTDALLTVLTKQNGKLTVKARGLRRKNSPLIAPCQLLAYGEFTLFEYRGMYTINEAHALELFQKLRKDLNKLSLGTYFVHAAATLSQEDMPNPELLSLVLNCLYALDQFDISEQQVKAVFELRSACLAGYMPELQGCYYCANPLPDRFNIAEGRLECSTCKQAGENGLRMPVSVGVLDALRYICGCDVKKIFQFRVGQDTAQALSEISEAYLTTQLEQGFSTLDFYKTLQLQNELQSRSFHD